MADKPIHETKTEARAADGNPVNRYILIASMILIVVAFVIIVATGWIS